MSDLIKEPKKRKPKYQVPNKGYWLHFDYDSQGNPLKPEEILSLLAMAGEEYRNGHCLLTIEKVEQQKTLPQIGYYYGVIRPFIYKLIREAGNEYSLGQTHYFLKKECGVNEEMADVTTGELFYRVRSLAEYSIEDFGTFIESLSRFAAEHFGVTIPEPTGNEWVNRIE